MARRPFIGEAKSKLATWSGRLALFALSYAGLGISMYPYIVPQSITIWQAASPENSQIFMLFGVAVLVPLILGYTAWAYWVFRGKVRPGSGYH